MKPNPVVHFEMPAKDKKRTKKFYEAVFGWKMDLLGKEMGSYLLAHTTETSKDGMVKTKGAINGGFFDYQNKPGYKEPHLVIAVDDLKKSKALVKKAGGKISGKPMDIPGIGLYVSLKDTEGNLVGMLQPTR